MKKRTKYKYFEVAPDGSVRLGARIRYEEARRRGYEFECPFA